MSEPQGIERPAPPYAPGDRIFDRVALNGAAYLVLECNPIGEQLAGATRAAWQVIFELPTDPPAPHYAWVDAAGYTTGGAMGPQPRTPDPVDVDRWLDTGELEPPPAPIELGCLIWSNDHGMWWGPDERGYTSVLDQAGIYSREQAERIASRANYAGTIKRSGAWWLARPTVDVIPELVVPITRDLLEQLPGGAKAAQR